MTLRGGVFAVRNDMHGLYVIYVLNIVQDCFDKVRANCPCTILAAGMPEGPKRLSGSRHAGKP